MLVAWYRSIVIMAIAAECLKLCSQKSNFQQLVSSSMLPGFNFEILNDVGLLQCVDECNRRRRCKSVNFNSEASVCHLNRKSSQQELVNMADFVYSDILDWSGTLSGVCSNHSCPLNSTCNNVNGEPVCDVIYCDVSLLPSTTLVTPPSDHDEYFSEGENLEYACATGYGVKRAMIKCGTKGEWIGGCVPPPSNCGKIRNCIDSPSDGEYWLRPGATGDVAIKVFCTYKDEEYGIPFLSLDEEQNFSLFPDFDVCDLGHRTYCGITKYAKIKIHLNKLEIGSYYDDYATCNCDQGTAPLGLAASCIDPALCTSTKQGSFKINTTGTGFIVDPEVTWVDTEIRRSEENRVVEGTCLSSCSLCHADLPDSWYPIPLRLDPHYQPPESAATVVTC